MVVKVEKIPMLFAEISYEECFDDDKKAKRECIVVQGNIEVKLKAGEQLPDFISPGKAKFLGKEVYDRFHLYVDRNEMRMERDVIIILPDRRTQIKLYKGDKLLILPVEGYVKTLIAGVGNRVRKSDSFAAVTTKKGEVHYLKPPKDGTVVYIDEFSSRPHYLYYLLPEE